MAIRQTPLDVAADEGNQRHDLGDDHLAGQRLVALQQRLDGLGDVCLEQGIPAITEDLLDGFLNAGSDQELLGLLDDFDRVAAVEGSVEVS